MQELRGGLQTDTLSSRRHHRHSPLRATAGYHPDYKTHGGSGSNGLAMAGGRLGDPLPGSQRGFAHRRDTGSGLGRSSVLDRADRYNTGLESRDLGGSYWDEMSLL